MASRPVQALAASTFGIYLWHAPLLHWFEGAGLVRLDSQTSWAFTTALLCVAAAIAGRLSYRFIEVPARVLGRFHLPHRQRSWHDARAIATTVRVGEVWPDAVPAPVDLAAGPSLVLVSPGSLRPPGQGSPSIVALRALADERFVVQAYGGTVGSLVADAPEAVERLRAAVRVADLAQAGGDHLASDLGVGGLRRRDGTVVPNETLLVLDAGGRIRAALRDPDGMTLVARGVDTLIALAGPTGLSRDGGS